MFEKVASWPQPIDTSTWKHIDPADLSAMAPAGQYPQIHNFANILVNIKRGLEAVEDSKIFVAWDFSNTYDDLVAVWADLLGRLQLTAQQQPEWLQSGMWNYNGTQVSSWVVTFDGSSGRFLVTNDPYLLGDITRQKDFGLLYEIGRETVKLNSLIKGGMNSALTRASLQAIQDKGDEAVRIFDTRLADGTSQVNSQLDEAVKTKIAQIKTVEASKDWSQHYEARCDELEKIIGGESKKGGLINRRDKWFRALMVTLVIYAIVALAIMLGWGKFKIDSSLDQVINGFGKYFVGLTLYGVLAGVYIGYAYAVRQLRVHQNLLEQYRHRAIVAKTIEGVVLAVIKTKEGTMEPGQESVLRDEDLEQLVKVAATSMFEYRPIGHLSTKEGTSILGELFNSRS